jgi:hypothetical protein
MLTFVILIQHISCQRIKNGQKEKYISFNNMLWSLGIKAKEGKSNGWVQKCYYKNCL